MRSFFAHILELIFPKSCLGCGRGGVLVCGNCLRQIKFLERQQCPHCRKVTETGRFCSERCGKNYHFDQLVVCLNYFANPLARKMIWKFKYNFIENLSFVLAMIMKAQIVLQNQKVESLSKALIVPVPSHKKRVSFRGFDQIKSLTGKLIESLKSDAQVREKFKKLEICDCLLRTKFKKEQARLTKSERIKNLECAIELKEVMLNMVGGKFILLIDDVAATCSTLNECAKVLKKAGARYVCAMVLARN
ncbi:MAG: double zinc ribbon domain-containing protein [Candidatus Gracilibacteria bacterium]